MNTNNYDEEDLAFANKDIIMQMVLLCISAIVVIITLISFIRIYSGKKEDIIKDMQTESELLEIIVIDRLNYSKHFINIMSAGIIQDYKNLEHINDIFKQHTNVRNINNLNKLFGWRKYSWINENFDEVVSTTRGVINNPKHIPYLEKFIKNQAEAQTNWKNNTFFYNKKKSDQSDVLKIIDNLSDLKTGKYIGSVVLSYDVNTIAKSLNMPTKPSTNFLVLDYKKNIVVQSKPHIDKIIDKQKQINPLLIKSIEELENNPELGNDFIYLDMFNGVNYFISKLQNLPFIIVVNIENSVIRQDIIENMFKKFLEVCVFAVACLFLILSISRREAMLRERAEKATVIAKNATKTKTDFLAFTAHEIRSPLGFIQTGSEVMQKQIFGKMPVEYMHYIDGIHQQSQLILRFINDILDNNQILEGKFKIVNEINDVSKIIDESLKMRIVELNKREVDVKIDIEPNLPNLICDKVRISQVFSNLVNNAIKYSKDGTTTSLTVKVVDGEMEIRITDQGIGIKEKDIPIALNAYRTIRGIDYQPSGSYGIGLAVVRMILEAHDATFSISSIENKGTTVKIVFPKYKLVYTARNKK